MISKTACILSFLIFTITESQSQQWLELYIDPSSNFYETQQVFNEYWQDKEPGRGSGYKQFKRWEYFIEPRVYPSGKLPNQKILKQELWQAIYQSRQKSGGGANWELVGPVTTPGSTLDYPIDGIGRINTVAFDPFDPEIIWAGAPAGGLWRSPDDGITWEPKTDNLPNLGVTDIVIDPFNNQIMYLATGDASGGNTYSFGVLKSNDGGETWDETGLGFNVSDAININRMIIDPVNTDVLFAAVDNGIYKTEDAGDNWVSILIGDFTDIEFKPGNTNILYASTFDWNGAAKIFRSEDAGENWEEIMEGMDPGSGITRIKLTVSPANTQVIYAVASDISFSFHGFYRSLDGGNSWALRSNYPNLFGWETDGSDEGGQGWYCMDVTVSGLDIDEVSVGGVNVWHSLDGGGNWIIKGSWFGDSAPYVHADQHALIYHPVSGGLYCANDGGVFKNENNWELISQGLSVTQFYGLGNSLMDENFIVGGTQDNGGMRNDNGTWDIIRGGDGMDGFISPVNPEKLFMSGPNGELYMSFDAGFSFTETLKPREGPWYTHYIMDPLDDVILYGGFEAVYKSEDEGDNWQPLSPFLGSIQEYIHAMAVAKQNPDYIYAALRNKIIMTNDGGENWPNITSGLPVANAGISGIAVHDNSPWIVWATFSGYSDGNKVYKSLDGGTNWINYSGSLPNLPIHCAVFENSEKQGVYIGTDVGIYYRDTTMNDWEPFMEGLPNTVINELEIHPPTSTIRAATYGRGIWKSTTKNEIYFDNTSINESSAPANSFIFYPNPVMNVLTLEFRNPVLPETVEIFSTLGQSVYAREFTGQNPISKLNLNLKGLPRGIYIISITGSETYFLNKFVKG